MAVVELAERKFIVTIRGEIELDVHDIQDAIIAEVDRMPRGDLEAGYIDVELIEVGHVSQNPKDRSLYAMSYKVLDVA